MRTVGGWVCVFLCCSFLALGNLPKREDELSKRITQQVGLLLQFNPLPHSAVFEIQELALSEQVKGAIINGKGTVHYTWKRISPDLDTLVVFTHHQSIAYQRTETWERAQAKIALSVAQSLVQYARSWWLKNGGGSPALIDSVRIEWLPDLVVEEPDTLYYPLKKLSWTDFQGNPRTMSRFGAEIFTNLGFDMEMEVKQHVLHIKLRGKCYMIRGISWVKPGNATAYTLAHEQLHFDITQRSLLFWKSQINALPTYWHPDDWSTAIQQAYLVAFRKMNQWQTQYDEETQHGQNELKQAEWQAEFGINRPN